MVDGAAQGVVDPLLVRRWDEPHQLGAGLRQLAGGDVEELVRHLRQQHAVGVDVPLPHHAPPGLLGQLEPLAARQQLELGALALEGAGEHLGEDGEHPEHLVGPLPGTAERLEGEEAVEAVGDGEWHEHEGTHARALTEGALAGRRRRERRRVVDAQRLASRQRGHRVGKVPLQEDRAVEVSSGVGPGHLGGAPAAHAACGPVAEDEELGPIRLDEGAEALERVEHSPRQLRHGELEEEPGDLGNRLLEAHLAAQRGLGAHALGDVDRGAEARGLASPVDEGAGEEDPAPLAVPPLELQLQAGRRGVAADATQPRRPCRATVLGDDEVVGPEPQQLGLGVAGELLGGGVDVEEARRVVDEDRRRRGLGEGTEPIRGEGQ